MFTTILSWAIVIGLCAFVGYEVYGLIKSVKEKKSKKERHDKEEEKKE